MESEDTLYDSHPFQNAFVFLNVQTRGSECIISIRVLITTAAYTISVCGEVREEGLCVMKPIISSRGSTRTHALHSAVAKENVSLDLLDM